MKILPSFLCLNTLLQCMTAVAAQPNVGTETGPTITLSSPLIENTDDSYLYISGTCSGGLAGSNGLIAVTGSAIGAAVCSSTSEKIGTWSFKAPAAGNTPLRYNFYLTDNSDPARTASTHLTSQLDETLLPEGECPRLTQNIAKNPHRSSQDLATFG